MLTTLLYWTTCREFVLSPEQTDNTYWFAKQTDAFINLLIIWNSILTINSVDCHGTILYLKQT